MGLVVKAMPWPFYPRERDSAPIVIAGWVDPRTGPEGWGKFAHIGIRPADSQACSVWLYRLRYPGPILYQIIFIKLIYKFITQGGSWSGGRQIIKKLPIFYETMFITKLTKLSHCSLPCQLNLIHIITAYFYFNIILSPTPRPLKSRFIRISTMRISWVIHLTFLDFSLTPCM
jgi:hypothetical protein